MSDDDIVRILVDDSDLEDAKNEAQALSRELAAIKKGIQIGDDKSVQAQLDKVNQLIKAYRELAAAKRDANRASQDISLSRNVTLPPKGGVDVEKEVRVQEQLLAKSKERLVVEKQITDQMEYQVDEGGQLLGTHKQLLKTSEQVKVAASETERVLDKARDMYDDRRFDLASQALERKQAKPTKESNPITIVQGVVKRIDDVPALQLTGKLAKSINDVENEIAKQMGKHAEGAYRSPEKVKYAPEPMQPEGVASIGSKVVSFDMNAYLDKHPDIASGLAKFADRMGIANKMTQQVQVGGVAPQSLAKFLPNSVVSEGIADWFNNSKWSDRRTERPEPPRTGPHDQYTPDASKVPMRMEEAVERKPQDRMYLARRVKIMAENLHTDFGGQISTALQSMMLDPTNDILLRGISDTFLNVRTMTNEELAKYKAMIPKKVNKDTGQVYEDFSDNEAHPTHATRILKNAIAERYGEAAANAVLPWKQIGNQHRWLTGDKKRTPGKKIMSQLNPITEDEATLGINADEVTVPQWVTDFRNEMKRAKAAIASGHIVNRGKTATTYFGEPIDPNMIKMFGGMPSMKGGKPEKVTPHEQLVAILQKFENSPFGRSVKEWEDKNISQQVRNDPVIRTLPKAIMDVDSGIINSRSALSGIVGVTNTAENEDINRKAYAELMARADAMVVQVGKTMSASLWDEYNDVKDQLAKAVVSTGDEGLHNAFNRLSAAAGNKDQLYGEQVDRYTPNYRKFQKVGKPSDLYAGDLKSGIGSVISKYASEILEPPRPQEAITAENSRNARAFGPAKQSIPLASDKDNTLDFNAWASLVDFEKLSEQTVVFLKKTNVASSAMDKLSTYIEQGMPVYSARKDEHGLRQHGQDELSAMGVPLQNQKWVSGTQEKAERLVADSVERYLDEDPLEAIKLQKAIDSLGGTTKVVSSDELLSKGLTPITDMVKAQAPASPILQHTPGEGMQLGKLKLLDPTTNNILSELSYTIKKNSDSLWINHIDTEEASRNKGYGSQLLAKAEDVAKERGLQSVKLSSLQEAVPFYKKRGYDQVGNDNVPGWMQEYQLGKQIQPKAKSESWRGAGLAGAVQAVIDQQKSKEEQLAEVMGDYDTNGTGYGRHPAATLGLQQLPQLTSPPVVPQAMNSIPPQVMGAGMLPKLNVFGEPLVPIAPPIQPQVMSGPLVPQVQDVTEEDMGLLAQAGEAKVSSKFEPWKRHKKGSKNALTVEDYADKLRPIQAFADMGDKLEEYVQRIANVLPSTRTLGTHVNEATSGGQRSAGITPDTLMAHALKLRKASGEPMDGVDTGGYGGSGSEGVPPLPGTDLPAMSRWQKMMGQEYKIKLSFRDYNQFVKAQEIMKQLPQWVSTTTKEYERLGGATDDVLHTMEVTGKVHSEEDVEKVRTGYKYVGGASSAEPERANLEIKQQSLSWSERLNQSAMKMRGIQKDLVRGQMSMLGMYFSMMSVTNTISRTWSTLAGQVSSLDSMFKGIAEGIAFGSKFSGGQKFLQGMLKDTNGLVNAWKNYTGLMGIFSGMLTYIAYKVFTNDRLLKVISLVIDKIAEIITDPSFVESVVTLIETVVKALPTIISGLGTLVTTLNTLTSIPGFDKITSGMVLAGLGAMILMPILAALGGAVEIVMLAVSGLAWALGVDLPAKWAAFKASFAIGWLSDTLAAGFAELTGAGVLGLGTLVASIGAGLLVGFGVVWIMIQTGFTKLLADLGSWVGQQVPAVMDILKVFTSPFGMLGTLIIDILTGQFQNIGNDMANIAIQAIQSGIRLIQGFVKQLPFSSSIVAQLQTYIDAMDRAKVYTTTSTNVGSTTPRTSSSSATNVSNQQVTINNNIGSVTTQADLTQVLDAANKSAKYGYEG